MMKLLKKTSKFNLILVVILLLALPLRFYKIRSSLQFLGDQGRDSLIVAKIFKEGDLVFIGPVTSVGNMYLGPFYYYFMAPFLFLSYPSPMGPVYAVAIVGCLTLFLVYYLGKELIGKYPALVATFFYGFSFVVVKYTRFSWNPNILPLFSLIMVWATYRAWKKNAIYWLLVAFCFSILIQLHYLALLTAAGAGLVWLTQLYEILKSKKKSVKQLALKRLLLFTALGGVLFLISLTPLVLFDWKHNWLNVKAFQHLLVGEQAFTATNNYPVSFTIWKSFKELHGRAMQILFEFAIGQQRLLNTILAATSLAILGLALRIAKSKKDTTYYGKFVVAAYLLTGIFGTSVYEHTVFVHYIAFLFPITFLTYGIVFEFIYKKTKKIFSTLVFLSFAVFFLWYNFKKMPFKAIDWDLDDIHKTAQTIVDRVADNELYAIILLSESGDLYGMNYQYYLYALGKPTVRMEEFGNIDKLFVINENQPGVDVMSLNMWEIVSFHDKKLGEVYDIENGPQISIIERASNSE